LLENVGIDVINSLVVL